MRFLVISFHLPGVALAITRCLNIQPSANLQALHMASVEQEAANGQKAESSGYVIDTYIHIITNGTSVQDGNIPNDLITAQMSILNARYKSASISFFLKNTTRYINPNWKGIVYDSDLEYQIKSTIRQGEYKDLNIYFDTIQDQFGDSGILGYTTFPVMLGTDGTDKAYELDGVVVDPNTVPGGSFAPYNGGITLVHEVGHWFGLYHTFQPPLQPGQGGGFFFGSGCDGDGDYIYDTPAEESPAFGCPIGRNTCAGNSTSEQGDDPVQNYMDYSDDSCLTRFTRGQRTRMLSMYKNLRLGSVQ